MQLKQALLKEISRTIASLSQIVEYSDFQLQCDSSSPRWIHKIFLMYFYINVYLYVMDIDIDKLVVFTLLHYCNI